MTWTNYHNHCKYCDGVEEIETHVQQGIIEGVVSLGFSSHSPVSFENKWSMKEKDIPAYLKDIQAAGEKYFGQIEIYKSLEIDYFPQQSGVIKKWVDNLDLDYSIGSVHFVDAFEDGMPWEIDGPLMTFEKGLEEIFGNDIRKVLEKYFEYTVQMLEKDCPTILGHLDKIKMQNHHRLFFDENATWYQDLVKQALEVAAKSGVIAEVNTRGLYKKRASETYPGELGLRLLKKFGIPICLNSDAHQSKEIIGEYKNTAVLLKHLGFKELMVLKNNSWQAMPFDVNGIHW
ncbi:histidinol-phosphatase (PHP family) [Aquiflexum balticum DSM 16537]|uniref:Histidinol-phosphatase n=1 Tax=Aquiflexum balticum DSM 16537 TaxID=758820 RepID=A0A1W2H248_9BACT|nr:histidinol-phosphatase [Aquiflexum balticum]SMD42961.1 histidinol-phosphatase (PHP family) [Aquiflexum balticum DSM 16537]